MSQNPQTPQKFVIQPANYPTHLLLSTAPYDLIIYAANYSNKEEIYRLEFLANGMDFTLSSEFQSDIRFAPAETKQIPIRISPNIDGGLSLFINYYEKEVVQYKELVWHVKDQISEHEIQKIKKQSLIECEDLQKYSSYSDSIDLSSQGLLPHSDSEADELLINLNDPLKLPSEIDASLFSVSKGIFNSNYKKSLELLEKIKDGNLKTELIRFIVPYLALKDQQAAAGLVINLENENVKNELLILISKIVLGRSPQDAVMLSMNVSDENKKNNLLKDIIFELKSKEPDIAVNIVFQISDDALQRKVLFEVIKSLAQTDKNKAIEALQSLIGNTLSGSNLEFIKMCFIFLGYLTTPRSVVDLISGLEPSQKEYLESELNSILKIQVEEEKTRIEERKLGSVHYDFIGVSTKISNELTQLSQMFGNLDPNILSGRASSSFIVFQLYSLNFSLLFPFYTIDKELRNTGKSGFHYVLYPTTNGMNDIEWSTLVGLIKKTITPLDVSTIPGSKLIFLLLDCMAYTDKPTIILSEYDDIAYELSQKLAHSLSDSCDIMLDREFFGDSVMNKELRVLIENKPISVINLTLSYNFFNDTTLLKLFFEAMIN